MPRTSGSRRTGKSATSSRARTSASPAPALGAAHLRSLSADPAQARPRLSRPRPVALSRRRPPATATRRIRRARHASSRSAGWSRRRATICCSMRWPSCPLRSTGASSISAAASFPEPLAASARRARAFRPHRVARRRRPERGHRRVARGRHLRAALPHRQRRRPRRPAQRADGGRKPGTADPVDQCLVDSRVHRERKARHSGRARCRSAGGRLSHA